MRDPREEKLPRWAQQELDRLRRKVADAERLAEEARLATKPEESDAILYPYDEVPVGLGRALVRFLLGGDAYVDARVVHGSLELMTDAPGVLVRPRAANVVLVKPGRWEGQ